MTVIRFADARFGLREAQAQMAFPARAESRTWRNANPRRMQQGFGECQAIRAAFHLQEEIHRAIRAWRGDARDAG